MKKWILRITISVLLIPIIGMIGWYLVSFFPYLTELHEISKRGNQNIVVFYDKLKFLATTVESEQGVRSYAMRQAYRSLVVVGKNKQSNVSLHANNALWLLASYVHFDSHTVFGIWADCALYGCGKGLSEAARKYYGKSIENLSDEELAGIVLLVRNPQGFGPNSEKTEEQVNELLKKLKSATS